MPDELEIRRRLASLWEMVPAMTGKVTDFGRAAQNFDAIADRCTSGELIQGGVLRLIRPPREEFIDGSIFRVRRILDYSFTTVASILEVWPEAGPARSSEDFLIADMVEPFYPVLRDRIGLGFPTGAGLERVEHRLLQGVADMQYPANEKHGSFHIAQTSLTVYVFTVSNDDCE